MKIMTVLAVLLSGCVAASDQAALDLFKQAVEAHKVESAKLEVFQDLIELPRLKPQ